MEKITKFLLPALLIFTHPSCKKGVPENQPSTSGIVVAPGVPLGTPITKNIDGSGGTLTSADGMIAITVPAGAVASTTTFSIQAVSNTCPNGAGLSYKVLPEGMNFNHPVAITMHYTDSILDGMSTDLLSLAYIDNQGLCHDAANIQVDTNAKTISAAMTHFCVFEMYGTIKLIQDKKWVDFSGSTIMKIIGVSTAPDGNGGDYLVYQKLTPKWTLDGQSALMVSHSFPNVCTYLAPTTAPSPNPVRISAYLEDIETRRRGKMNILLDGYVKVGTYFEAVIEGKRYTFPGINIGRGATSLSIHAYDGTTKSIDIIVQAAGPGNYLFTVPSSANNGNATFMNVVVGTEEMFSVYLNCSTGLTISAAGAIQLNAYGLHADDDIEGSFSGTIAEYAPTDHCRILFKSISGQFGVKVTQ